MSGWQFEKVYSISVTGRELAFDGRFVWVTCSDGVRLYNYWGADSGNEPAWDTIDSLTRDQYDTTKLTLFKFIPISGGCHWIVQGGNKMYVTNSSTFTQIRSVDISTWEVSDAVSTPETMNSNLCWDSGKLWMVGTHPTSSTANPDQQKLHRYDGSAWAYTYIPQRKSTVRTWVAAPHNGKVYCTTYNNVAITKFDAGTGAYEGSIRINAFPTRMLATPERELFVSSYAGMFSTVDTTTNAVSNAMSTFEDLSGIAAMPGGQTFWFVNTNGRLVKLNRLDNTVLLSEPKPDALTDLNPDWKLDLSAFSGIDFDNVLITPTFTYSVWNGSGFTETTLHPYLFLLSGSKLHCVRLVSPLWRENFFEINGQAAIVTGDKQYFGEVG